MFKSIKVLFKRRRFVWDCFFACNGESIRSKEANGNRCDSNELFKSLLNESPFEVSFMLNITSGDLIFLKLVFLLNDRLNVCRRWLKGPWVLSEMLRMSASDELDEPENNSLFKLRSFWEDLMSFCWLVGGFGVL